MSLALVRILVVTFVLGSAARAGQTCVSASVPLTQTNWTQGVSLPRFDPSQGVLIGVRVQLDAHAEGTARVENPNAAAMPASIQFQANLSVKRPDTSGIMSVVPSVALSLTLSAYDGTLDFGGPSGATFTGLAADALPPPFVVLSSAADLSLFTGPASNPGTIVLTVSGADFCIATAAGPLFTQFTVNASAVVTVCYDYGPAVTPYCPGAMALCPCGNGGAVSAGCGNSGISGASLVHHGLASISAESFVLESNSMPAGTNVLFFQGTLRMNGGNGVHFGDGLLCVDGVLTRLAIKSASTGTAQYPTLGDTPVSIAGGVAAGNVRTYQAWYRDAVPFCTSATFNLTQGLEVTWVP